MSVYGGPEINDSGLVLSLDAANTKSYPGYDTTWTDLSGNGNNGALVNGPVYQYANGGNIKFDGINDCVTIKSNASILSPTSYTKVAWVKFASFSATNNIISGGILGTNHALFLASTNRVYAGHTGSWYTVSSPAILLLDTWHFIGVTFSTASGWVVYVDGVAVGTSASTSTFASGYGELLLGAYGIGSNVFSGTMGQVLVYNNALSAADMSTLYTATRGRYQNLPFSPSDISGLQLWLDSSDSRTLFSDTAGTTLATGDGTAVALWKDKSGNSRNASQSTSSYRPLLKTGTQNSLTTMRFDGSDDFFALPSGNYGDSLTCFIVYKWTMASVSGNAGYLYAFAGGTSPKQKLNAMYMNGAQPVYYFGERTNTAYIANTTKDVFILNVTTFTPTYGAANLATYNNGSSISISSFNSIGSGGALNDNTIGADKNTSAIQQFTGDMAEIIVYNSVLSSTQRQQVESYLNTKWKVY